MGAFGDRFAGAEAVARHPKILVSDIEAKLGTQFTVDTLQALRRRYARDRFVWLMGADNLTQLPRWRGWKAIFESVPIAVFARPGYSQRSLFGAAAHRYRRKRLHDRSAGRLADQPAPAWVFLHTPLNAVSATEIRSKVRPATDDTAL